MNDIQNIREYLDNIINAVGDPIFVKDEECRFVLANNALCSMLGMQRNDILGNTLAESLPKEQMAHFLNVDRMVLESGELNQSEEELSAKEGKTLHIVTTKTRYIDKEGKKFLIGVIHDVTESFKLAIKLKYSEEKYRQLVDNTDTGYVVIDSKGIVIECNGAYMKLIERNRGEIVGHSVLDWTDQDEMQNNSDAIALCAKQGYIIDFETAYRNSKGARVYISINASVFHETGGVSGLVSFCRNITDRKLAEEQKVRLDLKIRQMEKMETIGRLAGGVAHDFNNMLGVILGHTEMALENTVPTMPIHGNLMEIMKAGQRSAGLTRQLLAFASRQAVEPKIFDINTTVAGTLKMLRRLIGEDIELIWTPGADVGSVKIDPSQLDQILANLCVNARDAINGVGRVVIETKRIFIDESGDLDTVGVTKGRFVMISISDNGSGMDKEILGHLFEPFFTSKDVGKGTGLGLAVVDGVLRQNNGFIRVDSKPGEGSQFRVYLPFFESEIVSKNEVIEGDRPLGGGELILLVEDETALREMTESILIGLGYQVRTAGGPKEALEMIKNPRGDIRLLFTDVIMPEMNGKELAESCRGHLPNIKVLFMSGYTADVIASRGVLDESVNFIQKPFRMNDLATKVRLVLDNE